MPAAPHSAGFSRFFRDFRSVARPQFNRPGCAPAKAGRLHLFVAQLHAILVLVTDSFDSPREPFSVGPCPISQSQAASAVHRCTAFSLPGLVSRPSPSDLNGSGCFLARQLLPRGGSNT